MKGRLLRLVATLCVVTASFGAQTISTDTNYASGAHVTLQSGAFLNFLLGSKLQIGGVNIGGGQLVCTDASGNVASGYLSALAGGSYAYRDLTKISADAVSGLLTGLTAGDTTQKLFTTRTDSSSTYVRSNTWFGHSALDFTGVSVYTNGFDPRFSVTMLSPDVGVTASHVTEFSNGDQVRFVAADGTVINRTVIGSASVNDTIGGVDIRLIRFNTVMPSTIKFYKVLSNWFVTPGAQIIYSDQDKKVWVGQIHPTLFYKGANSFLSSGTWPSFFKLPITGDSANPYFAILDGEQVVLGTIQSPDGGPALSDNIDAINAAMVALGSPYKVTQFYIRGLENSASIRASKFPLPGEILVVPDNGILPFGLLQGVNDIVSADGTVLVHGNTVAHTSTVYDILFENFSSISFGAGKAIIFRDALSANGTSIASASTINLDSATGDTVDITGSTNISTITLAAGKQRTLRFVSNGGYLINSSSLIAPAGTNFPWKAGDYGVVRGYASGVVRFIDYQRYDGTAPVASNPFDQILNTGDDVTFNSISSQDGSQIEQVRALWENGNNSKIVSVENDNELHFNAGGQMSKVDFEVGSATLFGTGLLSGLGSWSAHRAFWSRTGDPADGVELFSPQVQDPDLDAIAAFSGTGFAVRTAANTWAQRSIAAGAGVTVTNGSGVGGNPTVALDSAGLPVAIMDHKASDATAILPIILYVKGVTVLTSGVPADIATIAVPAGITRWRPRLSGAGTRGTGNTIVAETASGTLAAAAIGAFDASGGGGNSLITPLSLGGLTAAGTGIEWYNGSGPGYTTSSTIYIRQTVNSANAGTASFYIEILPLP